MRLVEERSLSSILRSNLLTTLINNNDVSEKPSASWGARTLWTNFTRRRRRLRLRRSARPSLYNIVPKREGATLLPYIHHSETSLGCYVPDKPVKAVERCEFIYYLAEENSWTDWGHELGIISRHQMPRDNLST
jgi:hypothetical protein